MPRYTYRRCRSCGRHSTEVGPLSWTRLCGECGALLLHENVIGLHTMQGPAVRRWRQGMAASVGAVLIDDHREQT